MTFVQSDDEESKESSRQQEELMKTRHTLRKPYKKDPFFSSSAAWRPKPKLAIPPLIEQLLISLIQIVNAFSTEPVLFLILFRQRVRVRAGTLRSTAPGNAYGSVNIFSHIYNGDLKWHLGERY
jgi:hypothetical protein